MNDFNLTLEQKIARFQVPHIQCFELDMRDVASSSLQKSLRRGSLSPALIATKFLLESNVAYFWRRLATIVIEDFGICDLKLTEDVMRAAHNKTWRLYSDDTLRAASYLIFRLCRTPRDRRIDDLYMLAHACLKGRIYQQKVDQSSESLQQLVEETKRLTLTCERPVPMRSVRALNVGACENYLKKWDDEPLVELVQRARKISQCLLPLLLPLWLKFTAKHDLAVELSSTPVESPVQRGILLAALDGYTAVGRTVLASLITKGTPLHRFLSANKLSANAKAAAMLLFAVEGGVLPQKLVDPLSCELEGLAMGCWCGLSPERLPEGLAIMRGLLPDVQSRRLEALASASHPPSHFNAF